MLRVLWNKTWRWLRLVTGTYNQGLEESSEFNDSIWPSFQRLQVEFELLPLPKTGLPQRPAWFKAAFATATSPVGTQDYCSLHKEIAALIDKVKTQTICTRFDLYKIESAIIQLCSCEAILHVYPSIRERYRNIAGADAFKAYIEGQRPDPKQRPHDPGRLREDALHLLSEMRRLSIALPRREQIRGALLMNLILVNGTIALALILILIFYPWQHFPLAWLVAIWSLLGGMISVTRRLQTLPDEQINLAQWGRLPFLLSPITSICFGLILLYLFASGALSGPFFPNMLRILADPLPSGVRFLSNKCFITHLSVNFYFWLRTVSFPELTKLIIWSFIAGFAENFVPDTLDSLVKRTKSS